MGTLGSLSFGQQRRQQDHGPAYTTQCEHCQNETRLHAVKYRDWIHGFSLPLVPLLATRTLTCPICGAEYELTKEQFAIANRLIRARDLVDEGEITEARYQEEVAHFERLLDDPGKDSSGYVGREIVLEN